MSNGENGRTLKSGPVDMLHEETRPNEQREATERNGREDNGMPDPLAKQAAGGNWRLHWRPRESKSLCTSSLIPRQSFTAKLAAGGNGRVRISMTPRTIRGGQVLTKRRHLKTEVNGQESANSLWPGGWERHGRSAQREEKRPGISQSDVLFESRV